MRAISAIIGSMLATIVVATFVTLLAPQVLTVSRIQADNVAKRLASDLNELRGSEVVYVGNAIVEVQPDKIVVSSSGLERGGADLEDGDFVGGRSRRRNKLRR
jgi:hypothetical protein